MKCEGYRRNGGAFSLGLAEWEQCDNEATVMLELVQEGKRERLPACQKCWKECIEKGIKIEKVEHIYLFDK